MEGAAEVGAGYFDSVRGNKPVSLEALVQVGRRYRFHLLANPTVTRGGKRFGLHDEEARQAWLLRQGQHHGFDLLVAESSARGRLCVSQGQRERRITLDMVLFDGALQATDATAVRHAWAAGIGPGKAMGLGMLSLALLPAFSIS